MSLPRGSSFYSDFETANDGRQIIELWAKKGFRPFNIISRAIDGKNAVDMVGHHHKRIRLDKRKMLRDFLQAISSLHYQFVASQIGVGKCSGSQVNFTKETLAVFGADGNEIATGLVVVVARQPGRIEAVTLNVQAIGVFHGEVD